jgi:EmrB/QacA subfamily drug resistance transporter
VSAEAIKRPNLVLLVVGLGTLLGAMTASMVNLALPSIGRELEVSIESSRWVVQSFLLVNAVLLLPAGRLGDLLGHRRVYLFGFALFGVTSIACGLAGSFAVLVVGRVLQGLGAAMLIAVSPALLTTAFPPEKRGRALGVMSTATYIGLTISPPLSGLIISALGWRWTFYLMAPTSALTLVLGLIFLPRAARARASLARFDFGGAAALLIGLPLLLLFLGQAQRWGLTSPASLGSAALGAGGLVAFVLIQIRSGSPLVDPVLFRSRVFTWSVLSAVFNYVALFTAVLLMPFYLEEGLGLDPSTVGLVLVAQPLTMALVASPSGWLSDRIGTRGLTVVGMILVAGGLLGMVGLGPGSSVWAAASWLALVGLGTGIFISPNSSALMGAAPRRLQGTAGSVMAESRTIGMLLGVAASTAVFEAAGGQTGKSWQPEEFAALRLALAAGVGAAVLGAVAAALCKSSAKKS